MATKFTAERKTLIFISLAQKTVFVSTEVRIR